MSGRSGMYGCILALGLLTACNGTGDAFPITEGDSFFAIEPLPLGDGLREGAGEAVAALGVKTVGVNSVLWAFLEPAAPVGGVHTYVWDTFDAVAETAFRNGLQLEVSFQCKSDWATVRTLAELGGLSTPNCAPPKGAYDPERQPGGALYDPLDVTYTWDDLALALAAMVERYDGDGGPEDVDFGGTLGRPDYPLIGIIHHADEVEVPGHWLNNGGTFDNYGQAMEAMYTAVKGADPAIVVARSATNFGAVFDDNPDPGLLLGSDHVLFIDNNLEHWSHAFDWFGLHPNYGYTGVGPACAFVQGRMAYFGVSKPVYASDTNTTWHETSSFPRLYYDDIIPGGIGNGVDDPVDILSDGPGNPDYVAARARFYADQSNTAVKKVVLALASGYENMTLSTVIDWPTYSIWIWQYGGFLDLAEFQAAGGDPTAPGVRKPVYFAYEFLIDFLQGATGAGLVHESIGGTPLEYTGVVRVDSPEGARYVLWSDKAGGDTYDLAVTSPAVHVYENIEAIDQEAPTYVEYNAVGGIVTLDLDTTVLLVEPAGSGGTVPAGGRAAIGGLIVVLGASGWGLLRRRG